jgi:hypothetical protein
MSKVQFIRTAVAAVPAKVPCLLRAYIASLMAVLSGLNSFLAATSRIPDWHRETLGSVGSISRLLVMPVSNSNHLSKVQGTQKLKQLRRFDRGSVGRENFNGDDAFALRRVTSVDLPPIFRVSTYMAISQGSSRASKKLDAVLKVYEFHDHQHAIAILTIDFPDLLAEICDVLLAFRVSIDFIKKAGGNESEIPKALSQQLRPLGWKEEKLDVEITAGGKTRKSDTHKIDYVKGKVAFDLEWNSKDQTFDRDLYAFRALIQNTVAAKVALIEQWPEIQRLYRDVFLSDRKSRSQPLISPTLVIWPNRQECACANDRNIAI